MRKEETVLFEGSEIRLYLAIEIWAVGVWVYVCVHVCQAWVCTSGEVEK